MPSNNERYWEIADFDYSGIQCELISFDLDSIQYVMVFNRIDEAQDIDAISEKEKELGIKIPPNSYQVKFDTVGNFESGAFYEQPSTKLTHPQVKKLGTLLIELLHFHYTHSKADAYYFVAANKKLKRFYDRLAAQQDAALKFNVTKDLGDEGCGYELTSK